MIFFLFCLKTWVLVGSPLSSRNFVTPLDVMRVADFGFAYFLGIEILTVQSSRFIPFKTLFPICGKSKHFYKLGINRFFKIKITVNHSFSHCGNYTRYIQDLEAFSPRPRAKGTGLKLQILLIVNNKK